MKNHEFRTVVDVPKSVDPVDVGSETCFMGSCFAANIGRHMRQARLRTLVNPFGTLYNPVSILQSLETIIENKTVTESELVYFNGLWHSFDFHGSFSSTDATRTASQVNRAIDEASRFLQRAGYLVVTFGTAFVYESKERGRVVANCHKLPGSNFNRYMLDVDEIVKAWKELLIRLRVFNPGLRFIFSVSPVRYWRDGAHGNQVSKAVLLLAVDRLTSLFEKTWYFPAYEIVLDELRDYRFFDAGMLQPNPQAISYIWKRFKESQLNIGAQQYCSEVEKINRAREHVPSGLNPRSHLAFLRQMLEYTESLATRYPTAPLEEDRLFFQVEIKRVELELDAGNYT